MTASFFLSFSFPLSFDFFFFYPMMTFKEHPFTPWNVIITIKGYLLCWFSSCMFFFSPPPSIKLEACLSSSNAQKLSLYLIWPTCWNMVNSSKTLFLPSTHFWHVANLFLRTPFLSFLFSYLKNQNRSLHSSRYKHLSAIEKI